MDAHLLRLAADAFELLVGSRITKIYQFDANVFVFALYGGGKKQFLTLRYGKHSPLLFLTEHITSVGTEPPMQTMRLRKYLMGKRITNMQSAWWERKIYFQAAPTENEKALWFELDLRNGISLLFDGLPEITQPAWAYCDSAEELYSLLTTDTWKNYPILTPALRKTLIAFYKEAKNSDDFQDAFLDAKSLLLDLEAGKGDIFYYIDTEQNPPAHEIYPWALPNSLKKNKYEEVYENTLLALAEYGKNTILNNIATDAKKIIAKPYLAEIKKLKTLLEKLNQEQLRLETMVDNQKIALNIQANLYLFDKHEKYPAITVDAEEITLNPRLTLIENMESLFHQAVRGKRGLSHLVDRRIIVMQSISDTKAALRDALAFNSSNTKVLLTEKKSSQTPPNSSRKTALPKQVLSRHSKDGFLILLGKDTKGNQQILKLAAPNDYWLHTADGTSAHAIVRRDHTGVDIPQSTLDEAGRMVAAKSPFKNDSKVLIQYALAKHIQPMRNAPKGMVKISKSEGSFLVTLDED